MPSRLRTGAADVDRSRHSRSIEARAQRGSCVSRGSGNPIGFMRDGLSERCCCADGARGASALGDKRQAKPQIGEVAGATEADQVVFVIGAAGGIGTALCRRLAARRVKLVLAGRDANKLDALAEEVGGEIQPLDARDLDAVGEAVVTAIDRHGRLDGAVNLAGSLLLKPAHMTTSQEWDDVLSTNLRTAFALVRAVAPTMSRAHGGAIVLMSSAAARIGLSSHDAIAAAKAGVIGLVLASAATYAPRGVCINAVAPGLVRTPLSARIVGNEASLKISESMHALGRIGDPDDVASIIDWLLHPSQRWVTGQVFGVDGGLATLRAR